MINNQIVRDYLERQKRRFGYNFTIEEYEAYHYISKLLNKDEIHDVERDKYGDGNCPVCGYSMAGDVEEYYYCPSCGSRLNWRTDEWE